jgi:26S proteasome regulatory subunit N3
LPSVRRESIAALLTQSVLLAAHRTATLRSDDESQAVLLNLLLRNYLHFNLYDQADKLIAKSTFPETVSGHQLARYVYYIGASRIWQCSLFTLARIKAIQLDYSTSHRQVLQAIRKAPQGTASAGFQQASQKLSIIVQLLMGEIPERSLFRQQALRKALIPYFHITQGIVLIWCGG